MPWSVADYLGAGVDSVFCGLCGFGRSAGGRRVFLDPSLSNDADLYDRLYNQGQQFLGNLMTVSTLVLGFVVTGTFLAVVLTGHENYDAEELFDFAESAGKAAIAAATTLVLALAVSIRGSAGYRNVSAQRGHYNLQRSACYTTIAELAIYISFYFFVGSLGKFTYMQFSGPDICPVSSQESSGEIVREMAFCSRLGADFYEAAETQCLSKSTRLLQGPPNGEHGPGQLPAQASSNANATLCLAFNYLWDNDWSDYQYWFGYSIGYFPDDLSSTTDIQDESRQEIAVSAAQNICNLEKIKDYMEHACDYDLGNPALTQDARRACSEATVAVTKAEDCVENTIVDADRCYKVCSKRTRDGSTPKERLTQMINLGVVPVQLVFAIFAALRVLVSLLESAVNSCATSSDSFALDGNWDSLDDAEGSDRSDRL